MYRDNASEFPPDVKEPAYRDVMRRAYPIHPEVLKRFSEDWSTLPKFQRTRGILKIMANAVYALWRGQSNAPLILPGFLPLDDDKVLSGLLEPLDSAYRGIVQAEVDGPISLPSKMEATRKRYGDARAATRAARAVFLATAPHGGSSHSGVTGPGLRLACAQPGDQLSIFGDALRELSERAAFLYREGDRYRFSTQPTLNQIADERASDVSAEEADAEIAAILKRERSTPDGFHHVYPAPDNPIDVDDRRGVSLVILPPAFTHIARGGHDSSAARIVRDTLERRGSGQRKYRNCLVFCAADEAALASAREIARNYLAWSSINSDTNLTSKLTLEQVENAKTRTTQMREALINKIRAAWSHVIFPVIVAPSPVDSGVARGVETLEFLTVRDGGRSLAEAVYYKMYAAGHIVSNLGSQTLLTDLDKVWDGTAPHIAIAQLLEWFGSFVYLPRLRDDVTLIEAVKKLIDDIASPVAFAGTFDAASGRYGQIVRSGLLFAENIDSGFLVRKSALPAATPSLTPSPVANVSIPSELVKSGDAGPFTVPRPKRFFGSITLDPNKAGLQVAAFAKEVLIELSRPQGAAVKLTLEIEGEAPAGYPEEVVNVVRSNLRDLKLDVANAGFDDE